MKNKEKILIFNVNWLGDVLFSTAVIRNIRYNYPDSFIACVIPGRCQSVLEGNPYLDEVIIFDEKKEHKGVLAKIKFVAYLRGKKFDRIFLLHRSFSRLLIAFLAGIPRRIGYYTAKRGFLLTQKITPPDINSMHRIDYYLNVIGKSGLEVKDRFTDFFVSEKDLLRVKELLAGYGLTDKDLLVGINPGGNWGPKRWPKEYFSCLADRLIEELSARVLITGSQKDLALAEEIRSKMKNKPVIVCGQLSIKQFAGLAKRLDLFISADSGPLHIANAAGAKKIIGLFGPTDTKITGPYPPDNAVILQINAGCVIPCYKVDCRDNRCMKALTPDMVISRVMEIFPAP
ncbi:MAG: lipopolysaccharide heptosyltransferase II [Candidatus Omnitrophica bacterium]|jgi:lipopolysaccharide heptosyltransferase II|nr:lipopolysaccharide heptosyltransferase II [Candidatus Omnitrophota bacterium]